MATDRTCCHHYRTHHPRNEMRLIVTKTDKRRRCIRSIEVSLLLRNLHECGRETPKRPLSERAKATKDLLQAASLASFFMDNHQADVFNAAWRDAIGRGKGWRARALKGKAVLLRLAPELDQPALWLE
ncbi:MAG: hypothetical protein OEL20_16260 [Sulfuritalea sp.]|nr:hypothetical protein [Sulfuritalea sp.]